ncbi:MAG: PTS sugar transporter subunit IIB [Lachnospiraceae bacterium]|jgi:PTS system cellobiose-specific IIB component|nr:PTS sugar transporter subunit IIB [Lachnospiraceae bacterium]
MKVKILLACAGGMSTTMLVKKIKEAGAAQGYEVECEAYAVNVIKKVGQDADCVLLGPQAGFMLKKTQAELPEVPMAVIGMQDYGMMNGKGAFDLALSVMKKQ